MNENVVATNRTIGAVPASQVRPVTFAELRERLASRSNIIANIIAGECSDELESLEQRMQRLVTVIKANHGECGCWIEAKALLGEPQPREE